MAERGKRLTCPMCKDTSFYTLKEIEAAGGRIQCDNHRVGVEMVDLVMLMEILGGGVSDHASILVDTAGGAVPRGD